jgi:hypothetical protein
VTTLLLFFYLQLLDLLTTQLSLIHGYGEANPFVAWLIHHAPTPVMGLVITKLLAVGYGWYCYKTERRWCLMFVNWWFAGVVVWNLAVLIAGGAGR